MASIAFFPLLGSVHLFDWDEINFAEVAREMIATGSYSRVQIDFAPFHEKPPLFFWLQVLSMKLWGISEFAVRFPNALCGVLTLVSLYLIGSAYKDKRLGLFWALMHFSALLPHFYFKTGIIDPVFNYCIFLGIYSLTRLISSPNPRVARRWALFGGVAIGMAILTKGPVGLLIPCLTCIVYWIWGRFRSIMSWPSLCIFALTVLAIPLLWFGYEIHKNGCWFIKEFISYQITLFRRPVAGHAQPIYYHFVVIFLGCFPASVLALGNLLKPSFQGRFELFKIMQILLGVVMILFTLVTTKIVHYTSMAYFPITFLAAHYLYTLDQNIDKPSKAMNLSLCFTGMLVAILLTALPLIALFKERFYSFISDNFTLAMLSMPVAWSFVDCLVGIGYLLLMTAAYQFFRKLAIMHFAMLCSIATTLCLTFGTALIVPKVEAHTQKSAIEFYKYLAGQAVYVATVGFKSYAPLFYFQQPNDYHPKRKDLNWLLTGSLDRPAYFVVKITDVAKMQAYPDITLIKAQGCFSFHRRAKTP
ncbi:MAG: glycosyltransferase family 39 protein [Bacteroidota bacterium]